MYSHPQHGMNKDEVAASRQEGGKWLRYLRHQAGLSQRELGDRLGESNYSFLSQLESGKGRPPLGKMKAWAQALGVPDAEFAKGILRFYDPITFEMLFGPIDQQEPVPDPGPAPKVPPKRREASVMASESSATLSDILARLNRLEAILMVRGHSSRSEDPQ